MRPSITCLIPVYNCEAYIAEAINSVLNQSRQVDEFIVIDDGSTDQTAQILTKYGAQIKVLSKAHSGSPDTLNHGLRETSCDLITFLDSDDLWDKFKIEKQETYLLEHPHTAMLFTRISEFVSPELDSTRRKGLPTPRIQLPGVSKSCAMIRRNVFESTGYFSVEDQMGDFVEWYGRAKDAGHRHEVLREVLAMRRIHENNFTRTQKTDLANYARILKRALDRRRQLSKQHSAKN